MKRVVITIICSTFLGLCHGCATTPHIEVGRHAGARFEGVYVYSIQMEGTGVASFKASIEAICRGRICPVFEEEYSVYDAHLNPKGDVGGRLHIAIHEGAVSRQDVSKRAFETEHYNRYFMTSYPRAYTFPGIQLGAGIGLCDTLRFPVGDAVLVSQWLCSTNVTRDEWGDFPDGAHNEDAAIDLLFSSFSGPADNPEQLLKFSLTNDVVFLRFIVRTTSQTERSHEKRKTKESKSEEMSPVQVYLAEVRLGMRLCREQGNLNGLIQCKNELERAQREQTVPVKNDGVLIEILKEVRASGTQRQKSETWPNK
jgi:hypothetical protein